MHPVAVYAKLNSRVLGVNGADLDSTLTPIVKVICQHTHMLSYLDHRLGPRI